MDDCDVTRSSTREWYSLEIMSDRFLKFMYCVGSTNIQVWSEIYRSFVSSSFLEDSVQKEQLHIRPRK